MPPGLAFNPLSGRGLIASVRFPYCFCAFNLPASPSLAEPPLIPGRPLNIKEAWTILNLFRINC